MLRSRITIGGSDRLRASLKVVLSVYILKAQDLLMDS